MEDNVYHKELKLSTDTDAPFLDLIYQYLIFLKFIASKMTLILKLLSIRNFTDILVFPL